MKRCLGGRHPNHCMCPALLCRPRQLYEMETLGVTLLASDTVGRLSNGMSMKSKDAIFFDKNVETSVAVVPRVLRLLLPGVCWLVTEQLNTQRRLEVENRQVSGKGEGG